MIYGKLINGRLLPAPRKLRSSDTVVYNPPVELLRGQGFKPVCCTEAPAAEPGFCAVSTWMETETGIVQSWTLEPEGDIPDAEALGILLGGEVL